jgi:NADH-quinone oxidoreductase subunit C
MAKLTTTLKKALPKACQISETNKEVTVLVPSELIIETCAQLKKHADLKFDILVDLCGIDYLHYGIGEWDTVSTTATGYSRATHDKPLESQWPLPRMAVVYHLLSTHLNHRVRLKAFISADPPEIDSVCSVYPHANWYEREAFDLYGIIFLGHPDLRRILTDYGFKGFPFRKNFPLSGDVEMRYSAEEARCIYEPVSITPRTTVPKVVRDDSRYCEGDAHE